MKKSALVLSIISAILAVFAAVFLILTPMILKTEFSYMTSVTADASSWKIFTESVFSHWVDYHKNAFNGTFIQANKTILYLLIALGVLVVIWILHLVLLIVKKRTNALSVNIIYLVFGLVSWDILYIGLYPGYFVSGQAKGQNAFEIINEMVSTTDKITPISSGMKTLGYLPYLLGALALGLLLAAIVISIIDVIKYPGLSKSAIKIKPASMVTDSATADSDVNAPVFVADSEAPAKASDDSEIRGVLNSELVADENPDGTPTAPNAEGKPGVQTVVDPTNPAKTTITKDSYSGGTPTIVQYISYGAVNNNNGPVPPMMMDKDGKEGKSVTDEQLRRIISEELDKKVGGKDVKSASAEKPAGKAEDDGVMTSDDLRSIIREEMGKAGKPVPTKNNEPLTSDDLRAIIAQELKASDEPEMKKDEEPVVTYDEEPETLTSDELRSIIQEELAKNNAPKKEEPKAEEEPKAIVEEKDGEDATVIDQDDLVTSDDLRSIIRDELTKALKPEEATAKEEPKPVEEKKEEVAPTKEEAITTDDLRSIIRQELDAGKPATAPTPVEEEEPEAKPLTADDLRTLIQEALDEHDNPERRQLTEDEARELIVEQIRSYYLGKQKDVEAEEKAKESEAKAKKDAEDKAAAEAKAKEEAAKKAEEDKKAKEEADKKAAEEAEAKKKAEADEAARKAKEEAEEAAKPQPLTGEELRAIIREEITANTPAPAPAPAEAKVNPDDIKNAISEELSKFRDEQKNASEKAAQDEADAQMIAQARAEAQAEESKAQSEDIKNLKANALTPEQIRSIIAEELDKKLAEKTIVEEREPEPAPEPAPEPTPAPVVEEPKKEEPIAEPAPTPVVTEPQPAPQTIVINVPPAAPAAAPVAPAAPAPKIIRVPFPDRMVKGDKELKSNYNELKSECLSYGLKSRLSNSGDTFRLHTKTYVKITIAGKGLKIYFALNPKEYVNSPIPLHDAGGKNIYKDIPGVFKVKSSLSLKRAKQLIADACEKDNLEQGKIEAHNWAVELKDYKPQIGAKDDD